MRMAEIRERYAVRVPRRGATLLVWWPGETQATEREELYHSLAAAMHAAGAHLHDPRCRGLWLYDGRRLYDRQAVAGYYEANTNCAPEQPPQQTTP